MTTLATLIGLLSLATLSFAQPQRLTLADAEALAVRNHPALAAARLMAEAQAQVPRQVRSAYTPQVGIGVSGVAASERARIGAGLFTNPLILSRAGFGGNFSQLLYDGGRTKLLAESATARAKGEAETAHVTRAQVLLQVRQAYFLALRAQTALRLVALLPAVPAPTDESSKSRLDALSAEIAAAEAKIKISQARHEAQAAQADLAVAVGQTRPADWVLEEPPAPGPLPADSQSLLAIAIRQRPEIAVRRRELEAAQSMVAAEGKLTKPSVSGFGVAGVVPAHVAGYEKDYYAAAGLALNLNFLNGGLFAARRTEAALRARAAEQRLKELENRLAREVSVAFFNAENAFDRLSLSNLFLKRAGLSLELAQARYDRGLCTLAEFNQAQLSKGTAELQQASARYDYASQTAALSFQLGSDFN